MIESVSHSEWLGFGVLAGAFHAAWLFRDCRRPVSWLPLGGVFRVLGVAVVLGLAARAGGLGATGAGWSVGFTMLVAILGGKAGRP